MSKKNNTPVEDMEQVRDEALNTQSTPRPFVSYEKIIELIEGVKVADFCTKEGAERFCKENGFSPAEFVSIVAIVAAYIPDMQCMTIPKDSELTFGELREYSERAMVNFIVIHRVNYIVHECMMTVYDLLDKQKKLRFTTKMHYQKAEEAWREYQEPRRKLTEPSAWYTLQDHLNITYNALSPRIEKVYETIRDYMIRLGWRDVELKGRIEVALIMLKVHHHSFNAFFKDFKNECGVDFSRMHSGDKMDNMGRHFASMCEVLGFKLAKDKCGLYDIAGFDGEKNQRVKWAWDDFVSDLRNDDLMDMTAKRAIELNPTVNEHYQAEINEAEEREMKENVDKLQEKFKVTKNKK